MQRRLPFGLRLGARRLRVRSAGAFRGIRARLPELRRTRRVLRWMTVLGGLVILLTVLVVLPFRWVDPPLSMYMAQQVVSDLRERGAEGIHLRHQWTRLEEIAEELQLAVIAGEDQRFPRHRGVDTAALREALGEALRGGRIRGASTITQQTAKNLYLWHGRSVIRKALEAWLAMSMELLLPKRRILEIYLNIVEWDAHVFGAEAAAARYYDLSAHALSRDQAAFLAAVLPNPHRLRIDAPEPHLLERQQWIVHHMQALGGTAYLDALEGAR